MSGDLNAFVRLVAMVSTWWALGDPVVEHALVCKVWAGPNGRAAFTGQDDARKLHGSMFTPDWPFRSSPRGNCSGDSWLGIGIQGGTGVALHLAMQKGRNHQGESGSTGPNVAGSVDVAHEDQSISPNSTPSAVASASMLSMEMFLSPLSTEPT